MIKTFKNLYKKYDTFIKGVLTALGMIAIYDWIIAPGLTAQNTLINIASFVVGSILMVFMLTRTSLISLLIPSSKDFDQRP